MLRSSFFFFCQLMLSRLLLVDLYVFWCLAVIWSSGRESGCWSSSHIDRRFGNFFVRIKSLFNKVLLSIFASCLLVKLSKWIFVDVVLNQVLSHWHTWKRSCPSHDTLLLLSSTECSYILWRWWSNIWWSSLSCTQDPLKWCRLTSFRSLSSYIFTSTLHLEVSFKPWSNIFELV